MKLDEILEFVLAWFILLPGVIIAGSILWSIVGYGAYSIFMFLIGGN